MTQKVTRSAASCQDQLVARVIGREDNPVVPEIRDLLRAAIDESGWKHDALWDVLGLPDKFYLSKMLSGEKPIGVKHLQALPDDIEAIFAEKYAETFGLIVVRPLGGPEAIKAFVGGLVGVLAPRLPVRASAMAKATLPSVEKLAVHQ